MTAAEQAFYNGDMHRLARFVSVLAAALAASAACSAPVAAAETKLVKKSGDWQVLSYDGPDGRICFAIASPKSSDPPQSVGGAHFYVSSWPKDGVRAEISVKTSAPLKPGAPASIAIDQTFYKAFSKGDRAFVIDTTDELKLLEAMKKGSTLMVVGQSERGVVSKDTYSLAGLTQALQLVSAGCK